MNGDSRIRKIGKMKVIIIESDHTEHEVEMEPPFASLWIDKTDPQQNRYFHAISWRDYTYPVFEEVIPTEFHL